MTTERIRKAKALDSPLGLPQGLGDDQQSAKLIIGAILAAQTPGKEDVAIALLRKFAGFMSDAVLKEVQSG